MELFIVTLTGTALELRVSPNDTVMSIKSKIQRFEGIPVGQQHLIWQNGELSDHQSLRDCSIPGGATLRLVLGMKGGPISTYRPPPVTAATATIRFTPTIHFASSVQSNADRGDDNNDSSSPIPQSSLLHKNDGNSESQKQITFYFVNTNDRFEFMRVVGRRHREDTSSNGHSTTSLLSSEESAEPPPPASPKPLVSSNLLSTSAAAQSLPYLQTDESALNCEQLAKLASTTSEPSVLKSSDSQKSLDRQASSSPTTTTAIIASYLCTAHGRDSDAYVSDTDDCLSSNCGGGGATYFLRPPSPEWDNRDLSSSPPPPLPHPIFDFPFLGGDEGEDDDSLADLEDCLIYYRSGDVLFGPPATRKSSSTSSLHGGWRGACGDAESPIVTQAKLEECESLVEKVKLIKAQLLQKKEERMQRRMRQHKSEDKREDKEPNKPTEETSKSSCGAEGTLPPLGKASSYGKPHMPKIRSSGGQSLKKMLLRRPYTTTSAVDLPTAAVASNSASTSTENLSSTIAATAGSGSSLTRSSLLLPSKRFVSRFLESDRRSRGTAPNKTTSETNLEAASVIPGFSDASNVGDVYGSSTSNSYFSRFGRSLRLRRFGTAQSPDISKIGCSDRLMDTLNTGKEEKGTIRTEAGGVSALPLIFSPLLPSAATNPAECDRLLRPTTAAAVAASLLRGRSPTVKKALGSYSNDSSTPEEITLPPILNTVRGNLTRGGGESSGHATTRIAVDEHQSQPPLMNPSSPSKTRKDTSEPPRRSPKVNTNRCASCNRKTGLVDSYTCRCERNFCSKHRYAELHACSFDYKADARRYIRETNPVVTAAKLPKI
ncbi:an1 type zinc finger [Echinococcus multilocularis]|uniref:An1 type zinc finger n=1 Tax=Echinococcus multilocularis TaxID=6211 RepID=A0A068Y6F4_ECHMU|nr:an1 type zinc finger [Echinococcus multilocularis]